MYQVPAVELYNETRSLRVSLQMHKYNRLHNKVSQMFFDYNFKKHSFSGHFPRQEQEEDWFRIDN